MAHDSSVRTPPKCRVSENQGIYEVSGSLPVFESRDSAMLKTRFFLTRARRAWEGCRFLLMTILCHPLCHRQRSVQQSSGRPLVTFRQERLNLGQEFLAAIADDDRVFLSQWLAGDRTKKVFACYGEGFDVLGELHRDHAFPTMLRAVRQQCEWETWEGESSMAPG